MKILKVPICSCVLQDRDTPTKQRFLPEPVEKQHLDHIGGHETLNLPQTARDAHVVKARIFAGK